MSVIIFSGPSLRQEDRSKFPHFTFLPPVRQGELYGAMAARPVVIGIIDGYFDGVPAVWHKEVLWAISAGVAIFGAASMGALRAAELHTFGMRGIGRIFEDYRDGHLSDDDDVALLHGPQDVDYLTLSAPMVNVHATLERAALEGVLSEEETEIIAWAAKAQFYQDRTWESIFTDVAMSIDEDAVNRLRAWLPKNIVDRKREDALLLLHAVDTFVADDAAPSETSFSFEWTETWDNAPWRVNPSNETNEGQAILDELRLQRDAYERVRLAALLQILAAQEAESCDLDPVQISQRASENEALFRDRIELLPAADLHKWIAKNDMTRHEFRRLMIDRATQENVAQVHDRDLRTAMLDQLRYENIYTSLRARARRKSALCTTPSVRSAEIPLPLVLVSWFFDEHLDTDIPDDLAAHAAAIGLDDLESFYELLQAEYMLVQDEITNQDLEDLEKTV